MILRLALCLVLFPVFAKAEDPNSLDELVQSCVSQPTGYPLCETILLLKTIGDDSIETIKEYMELKPYQYTALTALNFALTGRLRIRTRSYFLKDTDEIYDFRPGQFAFSIQRSF